MNLLRSFKSVGGVAVGFMAGIVWVAACGGGGTASIADTIAAAIDVSYSNTDSGLTAETVQAAIDELKADAFTDENAVDAVTNENLTFGNITASTLTISLDDPDEDYIVFSTPRTGYLSVPGIAFIPNGVNDGGAPNDYATINGARIGDGNATLTDFSAPVYLPNGATIITLSATIIDGGAGESVSLMRYNPATNVISAQASVDSDTPTTTDINQPVDNTTYTYFLKAILPDSNYGIRRVLITYTYTTPTF